MQSFPIIILKEVVPMKRRFLALAALFVLALGGLVGCSNGGKSSEESSFASSLYAAKNPYLENTSANNDLVSLIGLKSLGKYTLAVQDDAHPYTLQIRFMYLDNRADLSTMDATMVGSAALLLALIDDCEQVIWSYPGESELVEGSVGVDYINETYATDVKAAGQDEEAFNALCEQFFPDKTAPAETTEEENEKGDRSHLKRSPFVYFL